MEEKKFDLNSIIGFALIAIILIWMLYSSKDDTAQNEADVNTPAQQEQITDKAPKEFNNATVAADKKVLPDSIQNILNTEKYGAFAYSASLTSATNEITTIENDVLKLSVSNKGGQIVEAKLKNFKTYDSLPIYLIRDNNAEFNLNLSTTDNRKLATKDLYFQPEIIKKGDHTALSMKLKVAEDKYLEYYYELKPGDYMLDFAVRSNGLNQVLSGDELQANWKLKAYRHAKSNSYENRYAEIVWEYENGKDNYTGQGSLAEESDKDVSWIAFKQHFFTSILLTDTPFKKADFISKNLIEDEEIDTTYLKAYEAKFPIAIKGGEINQNMNWYYGPSDYKTLKQYDRNLDEIIPLGWGIFGWINKYFIIPFFDFISGFLPAGIAIIFLTIAVKLLLSPIQYKQYVSQAKMKVLRPEINELNEKYKDNAMKRQQETMKLYNKAGANPMSGCLPSLMQIPVFYALFHFFPSAFDLRQKSFLWAEDLSSYDTIAELPFHIPLYGDHISLFPILASIAIFFYMMMTTGQNMQPTQPGMPNMKFILYLSPIFMLVFFNNYASGLSVYYLTSNLITLGIMLVIKNFIIDDNKILAKIEQNKQKPTKKKGKFARKFQEIMEEAEKQQRNKNSK